MGDEWMDGCVDIYACFFLAVNKMIVAPTHVCTCTQQSSVMRYVQSGCNDKKVRVGRGQRSVACVCSM